MTAAVKTGEYPVLLMNHIAIMMVMLKRGFVRTDQVEKLYGMPVRIIPQSMCPDSVTPVAIVCRGPNAREELKI